MAFTPIRSGKRWRGFGSSDYPVADLDERQRRNLLARLEASFPEFGAVLINHRPKALRGRSLREAMNVEQRTPGRLAALFGGVEQDAAAYVSGAAVAGFRRHRPGESGWRSEPRMPSALPRITWLPLELMPA